MPFRVQIHRWEARVVVMEIYGNAKRNSTSNFSFQNELTFRTEQTRPHSRHDVRNQQTRLIDSRRQIVD